MFFIIFNTPPTILTNIFPRLCQTEFIVTGFTHHLHCHTRFPAKFERHKMLENVVIIFGFLFLFLEYYSYFLNTIPISCILFQFLEFYSIFWNSIPFFGIIFQFLDYYSSFVDQKAW